MPSNSPRRRSSSDDEFSPMPSNAPPPLPPRTYASDDDGFDLMPSNPPLQLTIKLSPNTIKSKPSLLSRKYKRLKKHRKSRIPKSKKYKLTKKRSKSRR